MFPRVTEWLIDWTKCRMSCSRKAPRFSLLKRSFVQTRLETMLTFVVLAFLYTRQFYVLLFAVETNVLPAARDICTQFRLTQGNSIFHQMVLTFEQFLFVDVRSELEELAAVDLAGHCNDAKYNRMLSRDMISLTCTYTTASVAFYSALILVLLVPQLAYGIVAIIFDAPESDREISSELSSEDSNDVEKALVHSGSMPEDQLNILVRMQTRISELEDAIQQRPPSPQCKA